MEADFELLATEATNPRWDPNQRRLLQHLASALPAAQPSAVNVRVWASQSDMEGRQGRVLNVAFDHPDEPLWNVELLVDGEFRFQAWLFAGDDTHLDLLASDGEPERFVDELLFGSLTFTVTHYAGRVARIAANRADISTSLFVPPANVGVRRRLTTRRRTQTLRWTHR